MTIDADEIVVQCGSDLEPMRGHSLTELREWATEQGWEVFTLLTDDERKRAISGVTETS